MPSKCKAPRAEVVPKRLLLPCKAVICTSDRGAYRISEKKGGRGGGGLQMQMKT